MKITSVGRFLIAAIVLLCGMRSSHAQVQGQLERFLGYKTTTTDTIPCKTNLGEIIEYQAYSDSDPSDPDPVVGPTAVVKGSTFVVQATFIVPGSMINGIVTLQNVEYAGMSLPATLSTHPIINVPAGFSELCTFYITIGPVPNYVCKGNITINLQTEEDWEGGRLIGHAGVNFRLFTVCNTPINCMSTPWVGVLEDSCEWAHGESDPLAVITKISRGLYTSQTFFYNSATTLASATIPANTFDLVTFLCISDGGGRPIQGQCYDASDYAAICLYSQGRGAYVQYRAGDVPGRQPGGPYGYFLTNPGILIGHSAVSQSIWENHQLVILLNQNISDPTIGLFDPYGFLPAVNISQIDYWAPSFLSLVDPDELTPVQRGSNIQVTVLGFP